ncbi:MAG: rhodanese-like domain-containing protein [Proteobacteria bacterium]|nr:rhodanese-like domain-containing protein [Pseudomonadota bacterium]MBU1640530.1 rhodanese-like domain-containing protein [Pseudomonadota bacterium]
MNDTILKRLLPLACGAAFFVAGCGQYNLVQAGDAAAPAVKADAQKQENVLKGKIVGKSNKAKTISIEVGKGDAAKTVMVKFDDNTKGIEHAVEENAAIIEFTGAGKNRLATVIKPKLAKLPQGTSEMKTDELAALMNSGKKYVLVDSRPAGRFHEGTIAGSINIPVPDMKKNGAALLPKDKDIQLVFYCGGPT